ncbi:hypothetical protein Dhaf_3801 [Desulfitobacterium hafniense DCB-2]|uniref:Uncharacterized protein n=1 Tax=Desulfitobacterium hafniense (strain DSM 10664 / DCB-2) TaxID=272564 RepID=B8FRQ7_DESHD|nr:hypothetical protein [Desulfitobacterium hafniense]ACL21817.1 hypothetical protein Dhaf_3801 [Desulfitobacterium hafniense DCB-2]
MEQLKKDIKKDIVVTVCILATIGLIILGRQFFAYVEFRMKFCIPLYSETDILLHDPNSNSMMLTNEEDIKELLDSMKSIKFAGIRPLTPTFADNSPYTISVRAKNGHYLLNVSDDSTQSYFRGEHDAKIVHYEETLRIVKRLFEGQSTDYREFEMSFLVRKRHCHDSVRWICLVPASPMASACLGHFIQRNHRSSRCSLWHHHGGIGRLPKNIKLL